MNVQNFWHMVFSEVSVLAKPLEIYCKYSRLNLFGMLQGYTTLWPDVYERYNQIAFARTVFTSVEES